MNNDARQQNFRQMSDLEHVMTRTSMYLGGKNPVDASEYFYNPDTNTFAREACRVSPAALKVFDEALVNAIDQATKNNGKCNIWVSFDPKTYKITIKNDGSCVPVFLNKSHDGRELYNPQLLFGEFRTSGNYDKKVSDISKGDGITGGTFGLGIKLTNVFSSEFNLETYDSQHGVLYKQCWTDGMKKVNPPTITKIANQKEYTEISFIPNFAEFGMVGEDTEELKNTLCDLAYVRTVHASVFVSLMGGGITHWCGEPVDLRRLYDMSAAYLGHHYVSMDAAKSRMIEFTLQNSAKLKWNIVVGAKGISEEGFESVSIINGIYVKDGTHIAHLQKQILDHMKPLALKIAGQKKITKNHIFKYLSIYMCGQIVNPEYTGQRKDEISTSQRMFTEYKIPSKTLDAIWDLVKPFVEAEWLDNAKDEGKKKKKIIKAKKYYPARFAGTKSRDMCSLFIAEGDSAIGIIDQAISSRASKALNYDYYGIYSIQGVPMNPRKEITIKEDPRTGNIIKIRSEKLKNNERLKVLVEILGLDFTRDYISRTERQNLNYGNVIIASDQDEDGKGNIRSQIINFFQTFWPELVRAGFVCFINTPIVRAFPKIRGGRIVEFFTEKAYKQWLHKMGYSEDTQPKDWEIVYYKGLGSHGENEVKHMFESWPKILMRYVSDEKSERACEVYFGKDADLRKRILASPAQYTEDAYYREDSVSITDHFNTATKTYQLYNIMRHIPHEIDGMTPSKRKVLAGARKKFSNNNERTKTFQLGGYVAENMNYHHGDGSLNETIIKMAQSFIGAKEFPLLKKLSNFGSRKKGGIDAAQPRYGFLKLNKPVTEAVFPRQDDYILNYTFDDGQRGEPVFYVPIVPLAILEHYKSPGHGWASTIWARDYWDVSNHVRKCIVEAKGEVLTKKGDFAISDWNMRHKLENWKGVQNSIGTYQVSGNTIVITEMPIRMWNEHFINGNPDDKKSKGIIDDPLVQAVHDTSTETKINIEIKMKPGSIEKIMQDEAAIRDGVDPIIKYFDLKQSLKDNLCLIGLNGSVICHKNYMSVFASWFEVRKRYYELRVIRLTILLRLKIGMLKNKIRFCDERHEMQINNIAEDAQVKILTNRKYQQYNDKLLSNPNFTSIDVLEDSILNGPNSNYDYLLNMTSRDLSTEKNKKMKTDLQDLEVELEELLKKDVFPGASIWLKELTKLDSVVERARKYGWDDWEEKPAW